MFRTLIARLFRTTSPRAAHVQADVDARDVCEDWADGHVLNYPSHGGNIYGPDLDNGEYVVGCSHYDHRRNPADATHTEPIGA